MGYVSTGMGDHFSALLMPLMALRLGLVDPSPFQPCFVQLFLVSIPVSAQSQSFRIAPQDVSAVQGGSVQIRCVVDNLQGSVQWAKDGFVLGKIHKYADRAHHWDLFVDL